MTRYDCAAHWAGMPLPLHHLRAGVIGTGFIGPVHIEALKRLGVQVTAICGSTRSAQATAERWGIPEVYGDYNYLAMLRSPNVDVVHITSPNKVHVEQSLAALKAGKHVVCEKPLGMTAKETARVVAAAGQEGDVDVGTFALAPRRASIPHTVACPATSSESLIEIGIPLSTPSPSCRHSPNTSVNAPNSGSSRSICRCESPPSSASRAASLGCCGICVPVCGRARSRTRARCPWSAAWSMTTPARRVVPSGSGVMRSRSPARRTPPCSTSRIRVISRGSALAVAGRTPDPREVGRLLGVSENTAKAHVSALLTKLAAADRAEAVARGFERGLLKP